MNPRIRHKTLTCIAPTGMERDQKVMDEVNKVRAPMYASDHRDSLVEKKIPTGYKVIGVKGFKNTYDGVVLHVADLIIWKPPSGWLDISPEGIARQEQARLEAEYLARYGNTGKSWLDYQNGQPKNFIKINNKKLRSQ